MKMSAGPILVMAGGTGGHVFPGLAVADALRRRNQVVVWVGTRQRLEARVVPAAGYEIEWISIAGLRGRGLVEGLLTPFRVLHATAQMLGILRRRRPACVLGMGGFVSGPGGIAAWLTRKPLVIHEQNAVVGTTNRILARFASRVFAAFPQAFPERIDAQVVGNPVRPEIAALGQPRERMSSRAGGRARILVLGGSQGAQILNSVVPAAVAMLPDSIRPWVCHQTGAGIESARAAYARAGVEAELVPFIEDMAGAYADADLVIARAGGLTVAELEIAGLAAVLVPLPHAIDDHQTKNAESFCANGAGILIAQRDLDERRLADALAALLADREKLVSMAETARRQAKCGAAEQIADACVELAGAPA